eukprot:COSAG05_NODE_5190_length_1242_cov_0.937008_2_plen_278_part_01
MSEPEAEPAEQPPVEPFCAHATSPQWPEVQGCTYAVGLDGSKLSWMAFDFAMGMVARRKKQEIDTVHILHIGAPDHKKDLVPAQLQPDKLKAETSQRNIAYRVKNTVWVEKEREDGNTVGDTLVQMSDHMKPFPPNFLVLGSFGRKEKESVYLGHVPNALMKRSNTDVFIVKQAAELLPAQTNGAMVWVVGTDNSAHARHALDMTLGLMQPQDKLFIFYAGNKSDSTTTLSVRYSLAKSSDFTIDFTRSLSPNCSQVRVLRHACASSARRNLRRGRP